MWYKSYTNNLHKSPLSLKGRQFDFEFRYNYFFDILLEVWNYLNRLASIGKKITENTTTVNNKNLIIYPATCSVYTHLLGVKQNKERK